VRALAAVGFASLTLAAPSYAQPTSPVYDADGNLIGTPFVPRENED
jgi:hypothetical protein